MKDVFTLFRLFRPKQWIKNLFLFLPLFFAGKLFEMKAWRLTLAGFVAFCLASSAVYILNDLMDISHDRQHPTKRYRPLASGSVSPSWALGLALGLGAVAFLVAFPLPTLFIYILSFYVIQNVAYSLRLKHIPILDVALVSLGFVWRILAGGVLGSIPVSNWIVLMTFLLALFLGFAKRRDDVLIFLESGKKMRRAVDGYNLEFIHMSMVLSAGVVLVCYIMYTLSEEVVARWHTDKLYLTAFPVLLGVVRYLQLTLVEGKSADPTAVLLRDFFIQVTLAAWVIMFYLIIYRHRFL
ncbi:MAG: decaprenyl-phosphate phosphoribosyltransferase [Flavobacteriales bacterium]|nr:decaprenyl-phosphate phosphoribosyltransferase [Flavobacteriales bacterium]MCX7769000.1 decaprenyl-phosphate phosphoribosyltransferase [Flavobacteriales bacterium]MDW8410211.1 decaprenyl-phosphate phosphoribosyltransferase [Flavobacteriales bacterium]